MKKISVLCIMSLLLGFGVVLLGAYTRLVDAGLGCPDWPGCYGQLTAPSTEHEIAQAHAAYPDQIVNTSKARTEMLHRYLAEILGGFIILLSILTYFKGRQLTLPLWLPSLLIVLVIFQGLLGKWTVTLRLLPLIVSGHLLGGFCTLSLLALTFLYLHPPTLSFSCPRYLKQLSTAMLVLFIIQISLGGWTSANYAALICPDFPTCQGQWWPQLNFKQAFNLTGAFHLAEPLSFMDSSAKTTIHFTHRLGALLSASLGFILITTLWRYHYQHTYPLRAFAKGLALILSLQLLLGVANIIFSLPLFIAVAHNGVAALLLLILITLNFMLYQSKNHG